jgi:LPXTG-motif cell wall-anchored protein
MVKLTGAKQRPFFIREIPVRICFLIFYGSFCRELLFFAQTMPLLRSITRLDMLAIMVNLTIGGGIYALPAEVFAKSGVWSIAAMLLCAGVISLIVACFAEVGSRFMSTGGSLVYAQEAFGPFAGFVTGWLSLVLRMVSMAAIGNIAVAYAGFFFPNLQPQSGIATASICVLILVLALVNYTGIKPSVLLNNLFTVAKVCTLLFFVGVGLFYIDAIHFTTIAEPPSLHNFTGSILLMVFAFSGFDGAVTTTGEMKDPQRDIPYSLFSVLVFKTLLYLLVQVVCIGTLAGLAGSKKPVAEAAESMLPGWGGALITLGALISFIATLNGGLLVASRICFGMAEQQRLPGWLSATHPRFHSPHVAIALTTVVVLLLALTQSLLFLLTITSLGRLLIYIVSCGALIRLRQKNDAPAAAFVLPAGKLIATFAILACLLIMTGSSMHEWGMLAGVLGIGVALWILLRYRRQ